MRKIVRLALPKKTEKYLNKRQAEVNALSLPDTTEEWQQSRQTQHINREVMGCLKKMSGDRCRCMYCEDSAGTDIEHFWPKSAYPDRMFKWENFLLSCSGCNHKKGDQFPLDCSLNPLLINPAVDDPWDYLDFDPITGNLTAKFDLTANAFMPKGINTAAVLQLSAREALASGYKKSFLRIKNEVLLYLGGNIIVEQLKTRLKLADEHGLLEWCFLHNGRQESPFKEFRKQRHDVWNQLILLLFGSASQ